MLGKCMLGGAGCKAFLFRGSTSHPRLEFVAGTLLTHSHLRVLSPVTGGTTSLSCPFAGERTGRIFPKLFRVVLGQPMVLPGRSRSSANCHHSFLFVHFFLHRTGPHRKCEGSGSQSPQLFLALRWKGKETPRPTDQLETSLIGVWRALVGSVQEGDS